MKLRFSLDNTLVTEPRGSDDMVTSLTRFRDINGLLMKQDVSVTFTGDGYELLRKRYNRDGWTSSMDVLIEYSPDDTDTWRHHYSGKLFLRDIEWDLKREYARVPIVDNSWYARLNSNKSIKINASLSVSKNGVAITPAPTYSTMWRDQAGGAFVLDDAGKDSYAPYFKMYDYLLFAIAYLSDDELTFDSTIFNTNGELEKLCITNGLAFRSSMISAYNFDTGSLSTNYQLEDYTEWHNRFEGTTLDELLKNISKLGRYSFIIDYSTSKPTLRIEHERYFQDETLLIECLNVNELKEKTETALLYSAVKFGSGKIINIEAGWSAYSESIKMICFNQEQFTINTEANIDNVLDLQLSYITSANVIHDIWANMYALGDTSYDNDIILWYVTTDGSRDSYVDLKNWIDNTNGSAPFFYNFELTNAEIALRYLSGIPAAIINSLPVGTDERFRAYKTAVQTATYASTDPNPTVLIALLEFDNDSILPAFDANAAWDTVLFTFTAATTGRYTFGCDVLTLTALQSPYFGGWVDVNYTINAKKWSGGSWVPFAIQNRIINPQPYGPNPFNVRITGSRSINMNAGDYVEFELQMSNLTGTGGSDLSISVLPGSFVECTSSPQYSYEYANYEPDEYHVSRFEFTHPITDSEWRAIIENPRGYINFGLSEKEIHKGRIESIKMNHKTGKAQFILNKSKKRNQN